MSKKTKRRLLIGTLIVVGVLLFSAIYISTIYSDEMRTLPTLKRIDDYPLYTMTYVGDYGLDDFLKVGAKTNADIETFVTKRLMRGIPFQLGAQGDACSAFIAKNENGELIYGRNFDWEYSPALQVITKPKNGYASISTVDLAYLGYTKENLPDEGFLNNFLTLAAPYLPFDGMNEKGLAVSFLNVIETEPPFDSGKISLTNVTMIRLLLDKAATVDEALELINRYNISFLDGVENHFFIADATGKSVIVEYWDGDIKITKSDANYQAVTNFIVYDGLNIPESSNGNEFDRFDTIMSTLETNNGIISDGKALNLLADVGLDGTLSKSTVQWSVLYNLTNLTGHIFVNGEIENVYDFALDFK